MASCRWYGGRWWNGCLLQRNVPLEGWWWPTRYSPWWRSSLDLRCEVLCSLLTWPMHKDDTHKSWRKMQLSTSFEHSWKPWVYVIFETPLAQKLLAVCTHGSGAHHWADAFPLLSLYWGQSFIAGFWIQTQVAETVFLGNTGRLKA